MNYINRSYLGKWMASLLVAVMCFGIAIAQTPEEILAPRSGKQALVTDFTNTLTPEQKQALENKLVQLDDSTSTQVSVVIVKTTGGRGISEFNQELGRAWGVGDKKFNNGVVLLIAKDDRKLDIAVGYGLEGALTDYTSQHIIDDVIVPNFKGNDYYRGIDEGTTAIIKAVRGEYNAPRAKKSKGMPMGRIVVMVIIAIVFLSMFSGGSRGGGGTFMSRRGSRGITGPIFWPSGGGGWSGGGGGSSGGFGGFGGGSFGGGGASGSW